MDFEKLNSDLKWVIDHEFEFVIDKAELFINDELSRSSLQGKLDVIHNRLNRVIKDRLIDFKIEYDSEQINNRNSGTTSTSEKIADEEPPFDTPDEITFEVENKQITLPHAPNIVINATKSEFNFHHTNTSNLSKQEIINDNLKAIANLGYDYKRLSNYHVRIFTPSQPVDFYLTTERFMDAGGPTIGKGLSELIKYLKSL